MSLVTSVDIWLWALITLTWKEVCGLPKLKSCMLYADMKAEIRNQASNPKGMAVHIRVLVLRNEIG